MRSLTIYEFDSVVAGTGQPQGNAVPLPVFQWLKKRCLDIFKEGTAPWLRFTQHQGHEAVQVTSFVGVIRAPCGFHIEVLPKVARAMNAINAIHASKAAQGEARQLLIEMLRCLPGFRHIQTDRAALAAARLPLWEVFIHEFLQTVQYIVKRGLRSDYVVKQENLFALRGKLQLASQIQQNLHRADRFYTEHDEFLINRPENRLIHAALRQVLSMAATQENQRLSHELRFVFADVPQSQNISLDFQKVRFDREMHYYADALAWARLILQHQSPLTGMGDHHAFSLLFPMEMVFEAYVAKHLARQLPSPFTLKTQTRSHHLVSHQNANWFKLKPDLLIQEQGNNRLVLDTKWKLLDARKANSTEKYGLKQSDFYQLYAYGQHYLKGSGDLILIYPRTDLFPLPVPVFAFPQSQDLRLWVLPFCLTTRKLLLPDDASFNAFRMPEVPSPLQGEGTGLATVSH